MTLTKSIVEDAAPEWFGKLGYAVGRNAYQSCTLAGRREALLPKLLSVADAAKEMSA
jgi:hypothetical protein